MHNIKDIRNNFEVFKNKIKDRNFDVNFNELVELDKENRTLIQDKEKFEMEKKSISKSKDETLFAKSKEITIKIDEISKKQKIVKDKLDNILSLVINGNVVASNVLGSDIVYNSLKNNNVEQAFIYSGGSIMPIIDKFYRIIYNLSRDFSQ